MTAARRHELPCSVFATDYTDFETRSFPNSLAAYPCDFAFYVADPISSIHRLVKTITILRVPWVGVICGCKTASKIRVNSCPFVVTGHIAEGERFS